VQPPADRAARTAPYSVRPGAIWASGVGSPPLQHPSELTRSLAGASTRGRPQVGDLGDAAEICTKRQVREATPVRSVDLPRVRIIGGGDQAVAPRNRPAARRTPPTTDSWSSGNQDAENDVGRLRGKRATAVNAAVIDGNNAILSGLVSIRRAPSAQPGRCIPGHRPIPG
jgi:hypothetical protein